MPESQFDELFGLRQIDISWAKYEFVHAHVQKSTASVSHVGLLNVFVENLMHLILFLHWVAVLNAVDERVKRLTSTADSHVEYSWFQTFAVFWMLYSFFWVIPRRLYNSHVELGT
jgi:hypothetical protein